MEDSSNTSPLIQEMMEDHKFIRSSIRRIQSAMESPVAGLKSLQVLVNMIRILEDRMISHFKLEEEHGILKDIAKEKPRYADDVADIITEHGELLKVLKNLRQGIDHPDIDIAAFLKQVQDGFDLFVKMLIRHESEENQLVQDAYQLDIGDKD